MDRTLTEVVIERSRTFVVVFPTEIRDSDMTVFFFGGEKANKPQLTS